MCNDVNNLPHNFDSLNETKLHKTRFFFLNQLIFNHNLKEKSLLMKTKLYLLTTATFFLKSIQICLTQFKKNIICKPYFG